MARTDLSTRLLSAGLLAPLLLLLLFRGSPDAWYWLVLAATALATLELAAMTHPGDRVAQAACTLTSVGVSWVVYHHDQNPRALLGLLLVLPVLGLLLALWRLTDLPSAALRAMSGVATPLYIGGLLGSLALLRRDAGELGPFYVLLVLKLSWLPDTGGFFAGRYLGKNSKPLAPRVSPKKTQIGFVGSLVGATIGVLIAKFWYLREVPLLELLLLGLVAGTLGQLGDLAESMIKRSAGIKDSGHLIPGHGGLLDRIDALLIVSPVLYLYAVCWR
ncbi:MAG TPA: phosphatidate cytidylyltransferase [Polyangiaceae bacterium]|nr:phosphatidate cytidylyltransferase [Polyangiaceae bacterium]